MQRSQYLIKGNASDEAMSQGSNIVLNWFEELKERVPVP